MAGNRPNTAPNNVQEPSHEQTQENTVITRLKSTVSEKLDRLCDTIKNCAATGAITVALMTSPANAQSTANEGEVSMDTVVLIEGKEYTYGQLYNMSSQNRQAILDKISNPRERIRIKDDLLDFRREAVQKGRLENQRATVRLESARGRANQSEQLNQYFAIATHPNTPQRERAAAIQHVLRLVDELGLSEKEKADTQRAMEIYAAKL